MPALYITKQLKTNTIRVGNKYSVCLQQAKCLFATMHAR